MQNKVFFIPRQTPDLLPKRPKNSLFLLSGRFLMAGKGWFGQKIPVCNQAIPV
jgi:hypothetical protein